ncbi:ribbon-helix-helix protein, CopG family [Salipiger aestuarii]|uniref:ribbon-helix-helix protein, CopG family n=1 Tax=Salipiger aestuarii TaxID=568098 RepID=UPI001238A7DC
MVQSDAELDLERIENIHLASPAKSSRVSVSFTERDHELLTQIAEDRDTSLAWVIRQAVSEYLDRNRSEEPQLPLPRPDRGRS